MKNNTASTVASTLGTGSLIAKHRMHMQKEGNYGREAGPVMMFRTGFDLLDFRLGYIDLATQLPRIGIPCGRILYLTAFSGVGKSTLAAQICRALAIQFPNIGFANYLDREQSMTYERLCTLNPFSISLQECYSHFILTNQGIYTEVVERIIRTAHADKMEMFKNGLRVPVLDSFNNHVHNPITGDPEYMPPPTIIVLDSLYMLTPLDNQEAAYDDRTNMDNARIVAANSTMLRMMSGLLEEANIMLIIVNHLRKRISTSRFPQPAQLNYLNQDEHLPGGDVPIYLSRTLLKMKAYGKMDPEKDYGIDGYRVMIQVLKSMTSRAGAECTLIYDPVNGYDNDLTNLEYLRTMKLMDGISTGKYQIPGSVRRFTRSNFKQLLHEDVEFRHVFRTYTWSQLVYSIPAAGARVVDLYSARLMADLENHGVDIAAQQHEKTRLSMATQVSEDEILLYDNANGSWYAKNIKTNGTRQLVAA
jgi:RecA/RadA recombinase